MAEFTLPNTPFPEGTSVSAYSAEGYASFPAGGPPGSPVATAEVEDGSLTFTGLTNHRAYFAAAKVGGAWQSKRFAVGENGPPPNLDAIDFANVGPGMVLTVNEDETGYEFVEGTTDVELFAIGMNKARLVPTEDADKDTENLQEALGDESPNEVLLGAGNFRTDDTALLQSRKKIQGSGRDVTVLELEDGADCNLIESADYGSETIIRPTIADLTLDGNRDNNAAGSGLVTDAVGMELERLIVRRFAVDCINHDMNDEPEMTSGGIDSRIYRVQTADGGRYGIWCGAHDTTIMSSQAIQCEETGFQWTVNGYMIDCHAFCWDSSVPEAMKTGYRLATSVHCVGCVAEGAVLRQVLLAENVASWSGGEVFNGLSAPDAHCFEIDGGTSLMLRDPWVHDFGKGGAVHFTTEGQGSVVRLRAFDNEEDAITGTPHDEVFFDVQLGGTTKIGKGARVKRKQHTYIADTGADAPIRTTFVDSGTGRFKYKDAGGTSREFLHGAMEEVATQASGIVSVSSRASFFKFTGNEDTKKINPTFTGHEITVWLAGTGKLVDEGAEGNLKLEGTSEGGATRMVKMVCDGVNWRQSSQVVTT